MKIVLVQSGPRHEFFPTASLLIGLHKQHPSAKIIWFGDPQFRDLVRFNNRVSRFVDISKELDFHMLATFYGADLCINPSLDKTAREMASAVHAKRTLGFNKQGVASPSAELTHRVLSGEVPTRKHILSLYYDLAEMKWDGEGYGLNYFPKTKQEPKTGACGKVPTGEPVSLKGNVLHHLDQLNAFSAIHTDDLYTAHAAIALRKEAYLYGNPPYEFHFFGKGKVIRP